MSRGRVPRGLGVWLSRHRVQSLTGSARLGEGDGRRTYDGEGEGRAAGAAAAGRVRRGSVRTESAVLFFFFFLAKQKGSIGSLSVRF
jgi:hypothetical protein